MRVPLRRALAGLKAGMTLSRLRLPFSELERRRRGFIILQIDALSHADLQEAIRRGYMPYLQRLLQRSHRLESWRCGAPSDTAAIQCSLMYGHKPNIPGFYWYDKRRQRPIICSWPLDMAAVEAENSGGDAGLFRHGSVYTGMASGGAQRAVFTTSAFGRTRFPPRLTGIDAFLLMVLNPWRLARAGALTVAEIFIELYQQLYARLRRRYVAPEGIFPLTRAFTHVLFRELTTLAIRLDIYRGVPSIYANYIGYDEVAHHLGPRSGAAYRSLKALDRQIRDIHVATETIGLRPYDVFIMSDHGMTESMPFHNLYGETLGQFLATHGASPPIAAEIESRNLRDAETLRQVEILSKEIGPRTGSATQFGVDRAMRLAMRIGTGPLQAGLADAMEAPLLAIYSSGLANVYFTDVGHRMSREDIEQRAPGMLDSLVGHPGIGLVLVCDRGGTLALHKGGEVRLDGASEDELSFLSLYDDPRVVRDQLVRLARMPSAGDLLVFGAYDGARVINFEDHGGAHGGLGGVQMRPFMISPRSAGMEFETITDATELHPRFVTRYQMGGRRPETPAPDPRAAAQR